VSRAFSRDRLYFDSLNAGSRREDLMVISGQFLAYSAALTSSWNGVRIKGISLGDYLIVAAALLTLVVAVRHSRRLPLYLWTLLPPASLFLMALVESIIRGNPLFERGNTAQWRVGDAIGAGYASTPLAIVLRLAISLTVATIIVVGLTENSSNGRLILKRIMYCWAAGAAVNAAYAVAEQFIPTLGKLPFLFRIVSDSRYTGLSNHPNLLGQSTVIALPLLIYMISASRGLPKLTSIMSLLISVYAIVLTGSRGALVAAPAIVAMTAGYFMFVSKRIPVWLLITAPLSVALVVHIIPLIVGRSRFVDDSGDESNTARFAKLEQAIDDFLTNPLFGVSVGAPGPTMVPLIILIYGGAFYFTIFYGSLLYPLVAKTDSQVTPFKSILIITAVGVIGYGLLNNAWTDRFLYWPFAAVFALKHLDSSRSQKHSSDSHRSSPTNLGSETPKIEGRFVGGRSADVLAQPRPDVAGSAHARAGHR
jgi:hypothetical protein